MWAVTVLSDFLWAISCSHQILVTHTVLKRFVTLRAIRTNIPHYILWQLTFSKSKFSSLTLFYVNFHLFGFLPIIITHQDLIMT